jgi:hypothetical protein
MWEIMPAESLFQILIEYRFENFGIDAGICDFVV